ncbi:MAG: helix-turn-helix domain-containing protein [Alicyclobacillus sp.]|nr:helix-turn-helix domain-containing protein [Alicyclobacillus sp.]
MSIEESLREMVRSEVREAVREAVQDALKELRYTPRSDKAALSVKEAAEVLGVGINKVYELTRRPDFPAIRDGGRIVIPTSGLYRWMDQASRESAAVRG